MMGKTQPLLVFILLLATGCFAQTKLFLKPHIGGQVPYAHYDRSIGKIGNFRPRYFDITDNYGLLLQIKLNDQWSIHSGWSKGNIGWGNRIRMPKHITNNPYNGPGLYHSVSNYIHRFPLNFSRTLKDITFLPIDQDKDLYLFNFKVHALAGISVDYIDPKSRFDDYTESGTLSFGDNIKYQEDITILNRWGGSVMAGIGLQYYHLGKERAEINLFYSQGLRNMIQSDINYTMNAEPFYTRMLARGSFVGATLSYPIKLKTFKPSGLIQD